MLAAVLARRGVVLPFEREFLVREVLRDGSSEQFELRDELARRALECARHPVQLLEQTLLHARVKRGGRTCTCISITIAHVFSR